MLAHPPALCRLANAFHTLAADLETVVSGTAAVTSWRVLGRRVALWAHLGNADEFGDDPWKSSTEKPQ